MNIGKNLMDRVISIIMEVSINGCIFIEKIFGIGWEAEHEKRIKKNRIFHLPI